MGVGDDTPGVTAGVLVGVDPRVSLGVGGKTRPGEPAGVGAGGGGDTTGTVGCGVAVGVMVAVGVAVGVVVGGPGAGAGAKVGTYTQGCALDGAIIPAAAKHGHKCSNSMPGDFMCLTSSLASFTMSK